MKQQDKTTKKLLVNSIWLKLLLFLAVLVLLFLQLKDVDWQKAEGLNLKYPLALVGSLALLPVNLGMEYLKWESIVRPLSIEEKYVKNAFWAGIASGFMTPNGWGNFLGRMIYFPKRDRLYIIASTAYANFAQLIPTLIFGLIAVLFVYSDQTRLGLYSALISIALLSLYFGLDRLIPKKKFENKWIRYVQFLKGKLKQLRWRLLLFSIIRHLVFSLQFVMLFNAFGYTDFTQILLGVWVIYLLTSFVPSLWSGKVLIRETAALLVFKNTNISVPDIIVVCILIYVINIALPAFLSSFVWLPKRK